MIDSRRRHRTKTIFTAISDMQHSYHDQKYRSPYEASFKLVAYFSLLFSALASFVLLALPVGRWLSAAAELQQNNVILKELEIEKLTKLIKNELTAIETPPEKVIIEEIVVKEIEPSWLHIGFWNWIVPLLGIFFCLLIAVWLGMLLYDRFGRGLVGRSQTNLSIFSASLSVSGMVFAAIRYQDELLEHEVGAYLFLSCLFSLIFFSLLLATRGRGVSMWIYLVLWSITVLVGWFTTGTPKAILNEYQRLLSDLTIPLQSLLVIGTALPVLLVTCSLVVKPDSIVPQKW